MDIQSLPWVPEDNIHKQTNKQKTWWNGRQNFILLLGDNTNGNPDREHVTCDMDLKSTLDLQHLNAQKKKKDRHT